MNRRDRELERILATMEMIKAELGVVEERLTLLGSALAEITLAKRSLEELKREKVSEVMFHIGGAVRLPGVIKELRPMVNVGRGVHMEMSPEEALEFLKKREEELKGSEGELRKRMDSLIKQYEGLNAQAGQIYAQMKGRGSGDVQIP